MASSLMLFANPYPGFGSAAVTSLHSTATTTLFLLGGPQRLKPATLFCTQAHRPRPPSGVRPWPLIKLWCCLGQSAKSPRVQPLGVYLNVSFGSEDWGLGGGEEGLQTSISKELGEGTWGEGVSCFSLVLPFKTRWCLQVQLSGKYGQRGRRPDRPPTLNLPFG